MYTFAKIGGVTNLESMNKTVIWKFWWKNVFGKKSHCKHFSDPETCSELEG